MRVDKSVSITISGRGMGSEPVSALAKGAEVSARIVERTGPRQALLELAGKRLSARFTSALPAADNLVLLLEKKSGATLIFRVRPEDPVLAARERLMDFTAFARADMARIPFGRASADGLAGVYAYNSLLLRLSGGAEKRSGLVGLLNKLAARGIKTEHLLFFSFLFSDFEGINLNCLASVLMISEREGQRRHNRSLLKFMESRGQFEGLENILNSLEELLSGLQDGGDILRDLLLSLLGDRSDGGLSARSGILYFYDEGFREAKYIAGSDAMVLTAEFTKLGRVDVLAMDRDGRIQVDVFLENEKAREAVATDSEVLAAEIRAVLHRECTVSTHLNQRALEVISELGIFLSQGGSFDARA